MRDTAIRLTEGPGLVGRAGDLVVALVCDEDEREHHAAQLADILAHSSWRNAVRLMAHAISEHEFDDHPPVACIERTDDDVGVFVFGDLEVRIETSEAERLLSGDGITTWIETRVPGEAIHIQVGPQASSSFVGLLDEGLIGAGGFAFSPSRPRAGSEGETFPMATQSTAPENRVVDETVSPPVPPALPGNGVALDDEVETPGAEPTENDMASSTHQIDHEQLRALRAQLHEQEPPAIGDPPARTTEAATDHAGLIDDSSHIDLADDDGVEEHRTTLDWTGTTELERGRADESSEPPAHESAPQSSESSFDSGETTSVSGEQLSAAVRAARAHADPRRKSEAHSAQEPGFELPTVRGLLCPAGHLTSMQDRVCRTCSNEIDPGGAISSGPRPMLGVLEFDDGMRIELDRPVVLGREVPGQYTIGGEQARVIPLTDDKNMVSRVHLEIHLVGWDVELIDKSSANGTFTRTDAEVMSKTRLRSEFPTPIELGTIVELGQRTFVFSTGSSA